MFKRNVLISCDMAGSDMALEWHFNSVGAHAYVVVIMDKLPKMVNNGTYLC